MQRIATQSKQFRGLVSVENSDKSNVKFLIGKSFEEMGK